MNWYLLQTKPNAHVTACENLRRQGFDVFLPLITKTTKKNGKFLDIKNHSFQDIFLWAHQSIPSLGRASMGREAYPKAVTLDGIYRSVSNHIIEGLKADAMNIAFFKV